MTSRWFSLPGLAKNLAITAKTSKRILSSYGTAVAQSIIS
jgi:hypothetical protein